VLTAHANGLLVSGGRLWLWAGSDGCVMQFAANEPNALLASRLAPSVANSFDAGYRWNMTPEELIALLARAGRHRLRR